MSLCIIDGDLIGFKASAACEIRFVFAIHKDSGRSKQFDNRTAFRSWLKDQDKWQEDDFNVVDDRTVEPIEYCLHTAKKMLEGIHKLSGCKEMKVVVQGEGNFRDDILLPTKYKGSRVDLIKPLHLKAVNIRLKERMRRKAMTYYQCTLTKVLRLKNATFNVLLIKMQSSVAGGC
jgi:hypothetical protein